MNELRLSALGRQLMSDRLRVFSTPSEHLMVYKVLQAEGPMNLEELKSVLVGVRVEGRTWTPTLVENVVRELVRIGTIEGLE